MALILLAFLSGCPPKDQPKPYTGSDISRVTRFNFAGIPIAHVQEARPYVHLELLIRRMNGSDRGLEGLALEAAILGGAGEYDANAFSEKVSAAGAILDFAEHESHVALRLRCLPQNLPASFKLMALVLTDPKMEGDLAESVIAERKSRVRAQAGDVDAQADALLRGSAFAGTASERPWRLSANDLGGVDIAFLKYLVKDHLFVRCNLALVVSGPIDAEKLTDLMFDTIDLLPEGDCTQPVVANMQPGKVELNYLATDLEAICGAIPAPHPDHVDAFAVEAAAKILDERVRTRLVHHLKIAISSEIRYVPVPPAHIRIELSGPRMAQSAELALSEFRKMKENGIRPSELDSAKKWMLSEQQMALESSGSWAYQAGVAEMNGGWANFGNPEQRLNALEAVHLKYVLEKYMTGVSWGFVGDTTRIDRRSLLRL